MKNVLLKRAAIIIIAAVAMSGTASAQQQGDVAVGGNLVISTWRSGGDSYTRTGIGAKLFYNVTNPIRLAGEFDYFLKKDYSTMWDLSVYGHYLFPVANQIWVYPSVGLGVIGVKANVPGFGNLGKYSNSELAISLGAGADYELTSNLALNTELRLKLVDGTNHLNIVIGLAYKF
jgi:outer membrane protein X